MKNWKRLLQAGVSLLAVSIIAAALSAPNASAQGRINKYTLTQANLGWTDISSTGTNFYSGWIYNWNGGATISLPFAFNYDNTSLSSGTTLRVYNGGIGMGTNPGEPCTVASSSCPGDIVLWGLILSKAPARQAMPITIRPPAHRQTVFSLSR